MLEETLIKWHDEIRQEALQEGQVLTLRKMLLRQLALRFGRVPKTVRSRVEKISSTQELELLTEKVLSARSLKEMGIA